MKNLKRVVVALMVTVIFASCVDLTTLAAEVGETPVYTVNIKHAEGDVYGAHTHTYNAYQIFKGNYSDGSLTNIEWGDNVRAMDLVNNLQKTAPYKDNADLTGVDTTDPDQLAHSARIVANIISEFEDDSPEINNFARIVKGYTKGTEKTSGKVTYDPDAAEPNPVATILLDSPGYYIIVDGDNHAGDEDDFQSTLYLLKVVGDAENALEINPKSDKPTLDKYIVENGEEVKVSTASVGDEITYRIKSKVPDMTGYDWYCFIVEDTVDETLCILGNSFTVHIIGNGEDIKLEQVPLEWNSSREKSFYVTGNAYLVGMGGDLSSNPQNAIVRDETGIPQKQNIKIVLENFITYHGTEAKNWEDSKEGYEIIIEYKARLMSNARIGDTYAAADDNLNKANVNKTHLIYSNDPYYKADYYNSNIGPFEPREELPVGHTPDSIVATYTTELDLIKIDENKNRQKGAEFEVKGSGVNVVVTCKEEYVKAAEGETATFYRLKDGTYTDVPPTDEEFGNGTYTSQSAEFVLKEQTHIVPETGKNDTKNITATVGEDGILRLQGLSAGEYTITETKAPAGYSLAEPITVTIGCKLKDSKDPTNYNIEWTGSDNLGKNDDGVFTLTIQNFRGTKLPETGGRGTVIFYIAGLVMMVGAVILFIVKKKSEAKKG